MKAKQPVKKQVEVEVEDKEEICKRCEMDVNECECWEQDAMDEMMREEW
jgi:hypothetical protein